MVNDGCRPATSVEQQSPTSPTSSIKFAFPARFPNQRPFFLSLLSPFPISLFPQSPRSNPPPAILVVTVTARLVACRRSPEATSTTPPGSLPSSEAPLTSSTVRRALLPETQMRLQSCFRICLDSHRQWWWREMVNWVKVSRLAWFCQEDRLLVGTL
ncbi:uncharacterized protein LOC131163476 [Malania oleifera]|uniref:uncharacterized protein LOC131163476 n=1 Tax=Malania oleifera TaxID=397392 RepID=UPI0025AE711D|nr:uncharacterized protein LOC131163476 [Malania oleifera]